MIGNDIIDIAYTKETTDWQRKGWLSKVCTTSEIKLVQESTDPFEVIWRMWSMKESAYKVYIQKGGEHKLNPKSFETKFTDDVRGEVQFDNLKLDCVTDVDHCYISTYAYEFGENQGCIVDASMLGFESGRTEEMRKKLLKDIAITYQYHLQDLSIQSSINRVPSVYLKEKYLDISISMSHHGRYAAYAFTNKT